MATQGVATWSKTAASNATADPAVNWAEGQAPSTVNNSARALMASVAMWRDDLGGALTTAGSSTAFTVTTNQTFATLAALDAKMFVIVPHTTSGADPTLAVDGLAAKQIRSATGVNVASGALVAGTPYALVYYNATTEFILLGVSSLSITSLTAETTLAQADEFPVYDASDGANNKVTLVNLFKAISILDAETTIATDDQLLISDTSASAAPNIMTVANFLKVVNALTQDSSPDGDSDFLLSYDASASAAKKVAVNRVGGQIVLQTATGSGASEIDVTTGLNDTDCDDFELRINLTVATDDVAIVIQINDGGGFETAGYAFTLSGATAGADHATIRSTSASGIALCNSGTSSGVGNAAGENFGATVWFQNPEATLFPVFRFKTGFVNAAGVLADVTGSGMFSTATAVTGIRVKASSGNISGRVTLLGTPKT